MATKEIAGKCFIAPTLCDVLDDMETKKTRGRTRRWIQRRAAKGHYNKIVKELRFEDTQGFNDMFRMNYSTFQDVLVYIEHEITPNEVMGGHRVISPEERLTLDS